jgi:RHS repeat-associated protein
VAVAKIVNGGTPQVWSIFRDHLGTITHLKNGTTILEYSFDAYGRRRNATNWSYTFDANDKTLFADRGFAGHEYLDEFGLINMNGRLYDPQVGRFLSPDNYIANPGYTQSYNRYGYCMNNPLRFTDPSGNYPREMGAHPSPVCSGTDYMWQRDYNWGTGGGGGLTAFYQNTPHIAAWKAGEYTYDSSTGNYTNGLGQEVECETTVNGAVANMPGSTLSEVKFLVFTGTHSDPYQTFRGIIYGDGSTWYTGGATSGGGLNMWDYISNGASVLGAYPSVSSSWGYYEKAGKAVSWTGKKGNFYEASNLKMNGGYLRSINYAKTVTQNSRIFGNCMSVVGIFTTSYSSFSAVSNRKDNTSTWVGFGFGVGAGVLTIVGSPVVITTAAIGGAAYGVGQLFWGNQINTWIDRNIGYDTPLLNQLGF